MKAVITFTFCCDNLWKSKFMALEKPEKLWNFFLLLCGHPDTVISTHMWAVLTAVLVLADLGSVLSFAFLPRATFLWLVFLCIFSCFEFRTLSVPVKLIAWKDSQNDLFYVERDAKLYWMAAVKICVTAITRSSVYGFWPTWNNSRNIAWFKLSQLLPHFPFADLPLIIKFIITYWVFHKMMWCCRFQC